MLHNISTNSTQNRVIVDIDWSESETKQALKHRPPPLSHTVQKIEVVPLCVYMVIYVLLQIIGWFV